MKKYIVIAGVNGAGKSTLYHSCSSLKNMPRVNLDDEVRRIGDWQNKRDVYYAGLKTAQLLSNLLAGEESFNQETTLCGRAILAHINEARKNGFYIELHYIGLKSVDLAKERVAHRVAEGGHGIPDEDIERRYKESLKNVRMIMLLVDRTIFYDNSIELRRIAVYEKGIIRKETNIMPQWYIDYVRRTKNYE